MASVSNQGFTLEPFALERFFAKWEFTAPYLLCCSDCQALQLQSVLEWARPETLELWNNLTFSYTETRGHPTLLQEISSMYESIGPQDLVCLVPEEGIFLSMLALLRPGDHVVVTFPGYQSLVEVAKGIGCTVSTWEVEPSPSGPLTFSVDKLRALVNSETKLVVINFPHNPTGVLLTAAEQSQVVDVCRENGSWLFSDEMYRYLEFDPSTRLPSAADLYDKAVALSGLSKSFSCPGLRLGWLASKDKEFLDKVLELKDYTTICQPGPSEILGIMVLQDKHQVVQSNLDLCSSNLDLLDAFFDRWSHVFEWHRPAACSIVFPRITTGESIDSFCEGLVADCGVLLLPASVYGHGPCTERGHFRLGFGRSNLAECLTKLEEHLVIKFGPPDQE